MPQHFQFPQSERTNCNAHHAPRARDAQTSFSFLNRNERTATQLTTGLPSEFEPLSVSSIGTNELQPFSFLSRIASSISFQFPQSERTNCNLLLFGYGVRMRTAFSFLNRNERTATAAKGSPSNRIGHLSVSSIGTNELQPCSHTIARKTERSFSFLNRNERTATYRQRPIS